MESSGRVAESAAERMRSCLEWLRSKEPEDLLLEVQRAMKAIEEMRQARARDTIVALLLPGAHSDLDGGCWDPLHRWYTKTLLSSRPAAAVRALMAWRTTDTWATMPAQEPKEQRKCSIGHTRDPITCGRGSGGGGGCKPPRETSQPCICPNRT